MLYQLPSGKVIYLSVEEYLSLSDEELHNLCHSGAGETPTSPWYGSAVNKPGKSRKFKENDLDYKPESDETDTTGPIDLNNLED